ncbi:hypothetical protein NMY22_g229 [Coprinellus aureogranulatus]|nr:hypothetical protein NMY22_g229 [Coprinellus aureogranulatus]
MYRYAAYRIYDEKPVKKEKNFPTRKHDVRASPCCTFVEYDLQSQLLPMEIRSPQDPSLHEPRRVQLHG